MKFGDNFLFKELVNTYEYTTATQDRDVCTYVSINGRRYAKFGTLQAVTFVGNLYKLNEVKPYNKDEYVADKYVLMVGLSKQHPCDTKINKQLGYETAMLNAMSDPIMIIDVQGDFKYRIFRNIVENYLSTMRLEFIKTKSEILASGGNPAKYNR